MDIDDSTDDNYPGLSVPWLTKNGRLVVSAWPCGVAANWSNITQHAVFCYKGSYDSVTHSFVMIDSLEYILHYRYVQLK